MKSSADGSILTVQNEPKVEPLRQKPLSERLDQVCSGCADEDSYVIVDLEHASYMKTPESSEPVVGGRVDQQSSSPSFDRVHAQTHTSSAISDSLKQFLDSYMGPSSIRASTLRQFKTIFGGLTIWLGPIMFQRWTSTQNPFYEISAPRNGFGLAIMMQLPYFNSQKAAFKLFFMRNRNPILRGTSVQWNLSFPNVVPKDTSIMRFARTNNVEAIRNLFQTGQAAASDTTSMGTSLLHVSLAKFFDNALY